MEFKLLPVEEKDLPQFKRDMQDAFQKGAEEYFDDIDEVILPESHIDRSLIKSGAIAYKAVADGKIIGGAIVVIDEQTQRHHLDLLYVKNGVQSKGIGQEIWREIEKLHPNTKIWETNTPYFDKRNIHFYINRCGFRAVEFFSKHHLDPNIDYESEGGLNSEYFGDFFRFEKVMDKAVEEKAIS